jgi:hypothetical protein
MQGCDGAGIGEPDGLQRELHGCVDPLSGERRPVLRRTAEDPDPVELFGGSAETDVSQLDAPGRAEAIDQEREGCFDHAVFAMARSVAQVPRTVEHRGGRYRVPATEPLHEAARDPCCVGLGERVARERSQHGQHESAAARRRSHRGFHPGFNTGRADM